MCTGIIIAGAALASAAVGVASAYQSSQAAKAQAKFQQKEAANKALDAAQRAQAAEAEKRDQINSTIGAARARQAANGLLVDDTADSSNQGLVDDLITAGQLDILKIRDTGVREGRGYVVEGTLAASAAKNEKPFLQALGAGAKGAASVYSAYNKYGPASSPSTSKYAPKYSPTPVSRPT